MDYASARVGFPDSPEVMRVPQLDEVLAGIWMHDAGIGEMLYARRTSSFILVSPNAR